MTRLALLAALLLTPLASCQTVEVAAPDHTHPELASPKVTHDSLSKPGVLQACINRLEDSSGSLTIPPGVYKLDRLWLVRLRECEIRGYGVTLVDTGAEPDKPFIRQAQTHKLTIRGLKVISASDVAWSQEHWRGSGTLMTKLDGVTIQRAGYKRDGFERGGVGLRLARKPGEATCADMPVGFCEYFGFERAMEVNGRQAVRIDIGDATQFVHCNYPVWINAGGHVLLSEQTGIIGARAVVTLGPDAGGSSLQPTVTLRDVYLDDAGGKTRLLDARRVTGRGQLRAVIDNVKCNIANGAGEGFDLILLPKGHPDAVCNVSGLTKTGKANTTPVYVDPPGEGD